MILTMTLLLTSLLATTVSAGVDPLSVPDYTSNPGSYGVPGDATTGLDATVTFSTDKASGVYNPGDTATIQLSLTAVQGDNDDVNKDLLFVLRDTDNSILYNYPAMDISAIHNFHLAEGATKQFDSVVYDLAGKSVGDTIVLPYEVYDFGMFGKGWQKEKIESGQVVLTLVAAEYAIKIIPTIYEVVDLDSEAVEVNSAAGFIRASAEGLDATDSSGATINATLTDGTEITLFAGANEGFTFYKWLYNIKNPNNDERPNPREVVVSREGQTFKPTPVFERNTYTVTAVSVPAGVADFTGTGSHLHGANYEVAYENVATNYTFTGWGEVPNTGSVNAGDVEVVAYFEYNEPEQPEEPTQPTPQVVNYDLTVEVTEGGSVPGFLGTNTFASGTNVNLTVVAEDGYVFTGWTGDVTDGLVVMNADKTVVANFELIVEDEETPEATPGEDAEEEVEEILDEVTPEATPEEDIQDEALPQTGGVPASMMSLLGIAMTGVGFKIRKRK